MVITKEKWQTIRGLIKRFLPVACTVTAAALLTLQAEAADWKISPSLHLLETYTDNVRLAQAGAQASDFVTQISPGISMQGNGARLKVNANYSLQGLMYAHQSGSDTVHHQLNAGANSELIKNFFFLDGHASISQQNISLFGAQTTNNINITGNRADVRTYSISPYLRHHFDGIATSELRYTANGTSSSTSGLSNSRADNILFDLRSGPAFRRVGWGLHYSKQKIDYTNNPSVEMDTVAADFRLLITPKFSLTASSGYDKNSYLPIAGSPNGHSWSAGFYWAPSTRTSLAASRGEKYFGKTFMLAANHRSRRTLWSVSYSEDVTSMRSEFLIPSNSDTSAYFNKLCLEQNPGAAESLCQQIVADRIRQYNLPASFPDPINYFTNQFFLQKRLQASVVFNGAKSTLMFSLFDVLREGQTSLTVDNLLLGTGNLAQNDRTKQIGANASWSWRVSPRTSANITAAYSKSQSLSTDLTNYNKTTRIGLTRRIQPKLNGSVEFRHVQLDSNQNGSNYRENAVTASLLMKF